MSTEIDINKKDEKWQKHKVSKSINFPRWPRLVESENEIGINKVYKNMKFQRNYQNFSEFSESPPYPSGLRYL